MKKITTIILLLAIGLMNAQSNETWTTEFDRAINWQTVTSLGNYIVNTNSGLMGVDTETGKQIWIDSQFSGINEGDFIELDNSPFAKIQTSNGLYIINLFDGKKVFNSQEVGLVQVVNHFVLYQSNTIVVAGKDSNKKNVAISVDIATGKTLWKSEQEFGRLFDVVELNSEELLGVTLLKNVRINSKSGDIIWTADNSEEAKQIAKMGAFGNMLGKMAENMVEDEDINLDFSIDPSGKYFVIGSQEENESMTTSSSSQTPVVTYTSKFNAYKISDGQLLWKKPIEAKGELGYMTWLDGNLLILPNGKNNSKVNLFDINTGLGLWGKKGKGVSIKGGIYSYTKTDEGMLVITTRSGKNFLNYLDTKNGVFTFDKTIKVKGYVGYTQTTPSGIVYVTEEEMNIVNPATGALLWEKDMKTHYDLVTQDNDHIFFLDTKESTIKGVNISSGAIDIVGATAIKFKEGESPNTIEAREKGIAVSSSQNIALYDYSGKLVFQNYFPSPKEAGWKKALLYAGTIYAGYVSAVSAVADASLQNASAQSGGNQTLDGAMYSELGNAYGDLSKDAGGVAVDAFKAANKRFKATTQARDYSIILSKPNDEIQLLKVNKDTGAVEGKINLGKNRKPNYAIDLVEGEVFLEYKETSVKRYTL